MAKPRSQPEAEAETEVQPADAKKPDAEEPEQDGGVPTQKEGEGGATAYHRDRLMGPEAVDLTGHPGHVVAGALADVEDDYLTTDEAKAKIDAWLGREIA